MTAWTDPGYQSIPLLEYLQWAQSEVEVDKVSVKVKRFQKATTVAFEIARNR